MRFFKWFLVFQVIAVIFLYLMTYMLELRVSHGSIPIADSTGLSHFIVVSGLVVIYTTSFLSFL